MSDAPFNGCQHPGLMVNADTGAFLHPEDTGAIMYMVRLRVSCPHCGAAFQFLGQNPLAPDTAAEAQLSRMGAWVTKDLGELACMIAPVDPNETLAGMLVEGRA